MCDVQRQVSDGGSNASLEKNLSGNEFHGFNIAETQTNCNPCHFKPALERFFT
jgi:hypothetical protein